MSKDILIKTLKSKGERHYILTTKRLYDNIHSKDHSFFLDSCLIFVNENDYHEYETLWKTQNIIYANANDKTLIVLSMPYSSDRLHLAVLMPPSCIFMLIYHLFNEIPVKLTHNKSYLQYNQHEWYVKINDKYFSADIKQQTSVEKYMNKTIRLRLMNRGPNTSIGLGLTGADLIQYSF